MFVEEENDNFYFLSSSFPSECGSDSMLGEVAGSSRLAFQTSTEISSCYNLETKADPSPGLTPLSPHPGLTPQDLENTLGLTLIHAGGGKSIIHQL